MGRSVVQEIIKNDLLQPLVTKDLCRLWSGWKIAPTNCTDKINQFPAKTVLSEKYLYFALSRNYIL